MLLREVTGGPYLTFLGPDAGVRQLDAPGVYNSTRLIKGTRLKDT